MAEKMAVLADRFERTGEKDKADLLRQQRSQGEASPFAAGAEMPALKAAVPKKADPAAPAAAPEPAHDAHGAPVGDAEHHAERVRSAHPQDPRVQRRHEVDAAGKPAAGNGRHSTRRIA